MEELDSVMDMEVYPQFMEVGNPIQKTIDIRKYFSGLFWASLRLTNMLIFILCLTALRLRFKCTAMNLGTDTGWAHLLNDDKAKFKNDYVRLMGLMEKMFEVE